MNRPSWEYKRLEKLFFTSFCLVKAECCMEDGKSVFGRSILSKSTRSAIIIDIFYAIYCIQNEINCSVHWSLLAKYLEY